MKSLFKPFKIIPQIKPIFTIWLLLMIFGAHLGILFSLFSEKIELSLFYGSLFIIAISLLTTAITPIFSDMIIKLSKKDDIKFLSYKLVTVTIAIIVIAFMAHLYTKKLPVQIIFKSQNLDWLQIVIWLFALFTTTYLFCLQHLELDYNFFKDLDTTISKRAKRTKTDGRGVQL